MPVDIMELGGTQSDGSIAPGGSDQATSDIQSHDPLVHLGLVDRTGAAVPTDDWQPSPTTQPAISGQPQVQPGQPAPAQPQVQGPVIDPSHGQQLQTHVATLHAMASDAYARAVTQGADPGQAQALIGARLDAEVARAEAQAVRTAGAPAVKSQVANIIAGKFGNGAVTAQDLLGYDSPQAMELAAQQLAQSRRNSSFQSRRAAGVDRVEGSSSPGGLAPAIAGLSPEKKIELGIRRGQY
jgi:hypothetical protein